MTIPAEFDNVFTWYNATVGNLAENNAEFQVWQRRWSMLTSQQRAAAITLINNNIQAGIDELVLVKAHIGSISTS